MASFASLSDADQSSFMESQTTRRQHHVWRYYLEAWTSSGRLYCRDDRRIFQVNPRHIAVEKDFYKLNDLTPGDLALLYRMVNASPPEAREAMRNFIRMLSPEHRLQAWIDVTGDRAEAEARMRQDRIQIEELFHSGVEAAAQKTLDALRSGKVRRLADGPELRHFCHFLGVQQFRTKGMKARVLARMKLMEPSQYLTPASWNIQSHIYGANVGASIYGAQRVSPIRVLKNETSRLFITGDQPVLNLYGNGDGIPPTHMAIYYPISPRLAVFIDDAERPLSLHVGALTEDRVRFLNAHIARMAYKQTFASTHACFDAP